MAADDGRGGGAARLVVALVFVAACGAYALLVAGGVIPGWRELLGGGSSTPDVPAGLAASTSEDVDPGEDVPQAGDFASYSWEDLSRISALIEEAGDDGAEDVARRYGLVDEAGRLVRTTRPLALADGTTCEVSLVGILHDTRADTGGKAGLSFRVATLALRPMNDADTCDGGWEGSGLRAWLASDGMALLPEELRTLIRPVTKLTNNVGVSSDEASVTATTDSLWLFSAHEVTGDVDWFWHEFGDGRGVGGFAYYDDLINLEGGQYRAFAEAGVGSREAGDGILSASHAGSPCGWWYRTAYPFDYAQTGERYFFCVMDSGYPDSLATPTDSLGVVAGFCL